MSALVPSDKLQGGQQDSTALAALFPSGTAEAAHVHREHPSGCRHAPMEESQHSVLHPAPAEQLGARERARRPLPPGVGGLRGSRCAQVTVLAGDLPARSQTSTLLHVS